MARCWAIIDTDREAIVGSIWLTAGSSAYCGVQFESIDADAPQRLTADSSSLSWIVQGHGSLPGWWPRSEHREENGSATHSERVIFDTTIARWCRPERLRQPPTNDRTNLWIRDSNRTLPLPDSNDEIVVMHQRENDKSIPSLAQLVRRNRADGRVVWEIGTDAFRCDDFPEALFQIVPPIGPLDTKSDWCCLVQIRWKPGMWLDQQCWRLDLATGDVVRLDLPISSAVDGADVAADGQSLLLVDAGYVRKVYSGGISSTATGKTTTDLMVWHPDQPARSVFQLPRVLMQMTPLPLPRSRVLVVADDGSNRQLQVAIVPLDGGEAHLLFP